MVKHKKSAKDIVAVAGLLWAAIILSLFTVVLFFGRLMGFEIFIIAAIWYGTVFLIRKTDVEYEYILTNSVLDIDKIMAKKTRKRMISVDFKEIDICAPAENIGAGSTAAKVLDLAGDINAKGVYYVDCVKNAQKYRVFFQPNSKILNNIKKLNPSLVTVRQEDLV